MVYLLGVALVALAAVPSIMASAGGVPLYLRLGPAIGTSSWSDYLDHLDFVSQHFGEFCRDSLLDLRLDLRF